MVNVGLINDVVLALVVGVGNDMVVVVAVGGLVVVVSTWSCCQYM